MSKTVFPFEYRRVKTGERRQWRRSGVSIVKYEHVSHFDLIVHFEQANVYWVHIENTNTLEKKIRYTMHYVVVFSVRTTFINK